MALEQYDKLSLSQNKATFLSSPQTYKDKELLSAIDAENLIAYYKRKFGIVIIKNGETIFGQEKIEKAKEKIRKDYVSRLKDPIEYESYARYSPLGFRAGNLYNYNLSSDEAWEEVGDIQKKLKPNEVKGYLYTGGNAVTESHFEVLIITKDTIIKPISWFQLLGTPLRENAYVHAFVPKPGVQVSQVHLDSEQVLTRNAGTEVPCMQANRFSCTTLGFKFLKELLKDNQKQLKEYTLEFPFYNGKGQLQWFFYPSPQVLRYSQSNTFNELIRSMLNDTEERTTITKGEKIYPIATIKGLLIQNIEAAKIKKNAVVVDKNTKLLKNLDDFRSKWIKEYCLMMEKRNLMEGKDEKNQYLAYAHTRMQFHASAPPLPKHFDASNPTIARASRTSIFSSQPERPTGPQDGSVSESKRSASSTNRLPQEPLLNSTEIEEEITWCCASFFRLMKNHPYLSAFALASIAIAVTVLIWGIASGLVGGLGTVMAGGAFAVNSL